MPYKFYFENRIYISGLLLIIKYKERLSSFHFVILYQNLYNVYEKLSMNLSSFLLLVCLDAKKLNKSCINKTNINYNIYQQ